MVLNEKALAQALAKVRGVSKNYACEVCQSNQWTLVNRLYQLTEYNRGDFVLPVPVIPLLVLQCGVCGHVRLMNPIALGLIDPKTGRWVDG